VNHGGINCTFSANQYDCEDTPFPPSFIGDGICENSWTYLSSSGGRFDMADCSPQGDADCPSERASAGTRVMVNLVAFVAMTAFTVFVL